ncbi:hypothetical protein EXU48_11265 [Occultella glacieicola]|uniref:Helix-turn-helix domain-containing protein n=1 Tax=Occultella glacieicola TaxID=2518684 RepID=A0ABY2E3G2_9MICO|nr:hypothetical protein [Occultella glacieicola]TDE94030.1 hypothetical protein EXU48_11265 [Occultella glacieicola]
MGLAATTRRLDAERARAHRDLRTAVAQALRDGMTQRTAAAQLGRTQAEVNRLARESPARTPTGERRRWMTARDAREAATRELRDGDEDFALRVILQARDDLRRLSDPDDIAEWAVTPLPIPDPRFDAFLGAMAARGLAEHDPSAPGWARTEPLPEPWYPAELASLRRRADREAPADLRRLGIMLTENDLVTA